MPGSNEANLPMWQRVSVRQVKQKGKSNHVHTRAQWTEYGGAKQTTLWRCPQGFPSTNEQIYNTDIQFKLHLK